MIGVDIVKDKVTKEYGNVERDRIVEVAFEAPPGCSWAAGRAQSESPGLVVTREEADIAMDVLEECISAVGKDA